MPGVIFDINIANNGLLYVCGAGFVQSLTPTNLLKCNTNGTLSVSTTSINSTCNTPGSATAIVSGGSPPYNIIWNTSPPQYGANVTNLAPGAYTVQVRESSCAQQSAIDTVVISANSVPFSSTPSITTGCFGTTNNGTITLATQGGIAPFTYSWSNGLPNSNTVAGLATGTYTLTITDNVGCTNIYNSLIVAPPSAINYTMNGSIKCYNDTISLKIIPSSGSSPYSINWTTPLAMGTTIHGIHAGNYSGTITDASGCVQPFNYTLTQPPLLSATSTSSYNCTMLNSGSITVNASGGTNPYSYSWAGFPTNTTNILNGLSSGIYTIIVKDGKNCSTTVQDTIQQPPVFYASRYTCCY